MAIDKNGKPLPKGITYRPKEDRYMGRFMYHGESFTVYGKTLKEVRKSLTIPAWLNTFAENNHINFSQVLQESLTAIYQKRQQA